MASRPYDGIMPMVRGEVAIPGVELRVRLDNSVPRVFGALYKGEVDLSEMSLAELIYYTSRDAAEFVAIPVFSSRVFRHEHIFCNVESGIRVPGDLTGKRIGFQRWVQTAAVWIRGTLVEHYGVAPAQTSWYVATTHHWDDPAHEDDLQPRDGSVIRKYETPSVTGAEYAYRALLEGEVDAIGVTEVQAPMLLADGRVRRLFVDSRSEEIAYFEKTRIFPIMHAMAMRRSLAEAHPELPAALFRAFCESKRKARQAMRDIPSWSLAWKDQYLEEEQGVFGGDLWPFGLAANAHVIDTFIGYCYQQGIAARQLAAGDLFHPATRELSEG
jgi:4,5-dihydroxyphthalate decarboxylase